MATQFSTLLKIALPTQGELSGSWGNVVNDNITKMVEEAIAGFKTINTWSSNSATLSTANGTTAEARAAILNLTDTGTSLSGAATVIVPTLTKIFIVKNGTAQTVTVKTSSGTGIAITAGETGHVYCDGTNVVESLNYVAGDFGVGGNLTVTGTTTFNGGTITLGDANTDNIVFGGEIDSNIIPDDDNTYDLGSASKEWKDIYIDGSAYIDGLAEDMLVATDKKILFRDSALFINSSADGQLDIAADTEVEITTALLEISADATVGDDLTLKSDAAVLGFGADTDVTLTHVADTGVLLNAASVVQFRDSAINIGSPADGDLDINADDEIELNSTLIDINGNVDVSGTSTLTGNVTLGGQLIMPDVTASKILIADGTSYQEKAVGDLSEISTVASGDTFLAVDASGGGLKKITRSTIVAGLATSGAIANIVEDTSPQLGGNLDMNGADIVTTSNATLDLAPNGTGTVVVRGNTNSGAIVFNCESNSHGQKVIAQPHSAAVTNTMLLPAGASSTLVSLVSTDTLTNKTLTTPVIAEIDSTADITLDAAADIVLDAAGGNIEFKDAATLQLTLDMDGTAGAQVIKLEVDSDDLIFKQYDGTTVLTLDDDTTVKVATDLTVGDDIGLISDAAVLSFGADSEVTLTHVHNDGLLLNTDMQLQFRDSAINIRSDADGDLDINADDEIELNSTLIDVNGNLDVSGTIVGASTLSATTGTFSGILKTDDATEATSTTDGSLQTDGGLSVVKDAVFGDDVMLLSDSAVLKFGADSDVTLTHAADTSLTCNLMVAATTFEPNADTAAGDDAAIGYTSAEGLILTGQGSSTDVTIKNDADATVASIATGTTILTVNDDVTVVGRANGTVTANTNGQMDLAVSNHFNYTPGGDDEIELDNFLAGQSGTIFLDNSGGHTLTVDSTILISASQLTAIATAGKYMLSYFCTANQANATLSNSANNDLIIISCSGALT